MRVLAAIEHDRPVDDHVLDAGGVLVRLLERGVIDDTRRVEDRDVGPQAGTQQAAIELADLGGVRRRHLAHGLLEPEHPGLAHVAAEHARKRAVVARMRMRRPTVPSTLTALPSDPIETNGCASAYRMSSSL